MRKYMTLGMMMAALLAVQELGALTVHVGSDHDSSYERRDRRDREIRRERRHNRRNRHIINHEKPSINVQIPDLRDMRRLH